MFTGIVQAVASITAIEKKESLLRYAVLFPLHLLADLERGASVSIDGVCQTVVDIQEAQVWFEAIGETLNCTTISHLQIDSKVNLERAAKIGSEIGGHLLSGHIFGQGHIIGIKDNIYSLECSAAWMKYLFSKGFIAVDGISLTLVDVDRHQKCFSVHLIPETLKRTTFGQKKVGSPVNLEFDSVIQAAVETIENLWANEGVANTRFGGQI